MRDREIRLLPQHGGRHLQNPNQQPRELGQSVLAIVMANALVLHVKQIRQLADLKAVAGGQNNGVAALFQLFHDGLEERDMGNLSRSIHIFLPGIFLTTGCPPTSGKAARAVSGVAAATTGG